MNTSPIPCLPLLPNIARASCPDPLARKENYWSSYIWKLNNCLQYPLRDLFIDLRYGNILFPDKTLDCGEMGYDGTNFTMNICGTDYDKVWCQITEHTYSPGEDEFITLHRTGRCGAGGTYAEAKTDYEDAPTYASFEDRHLNWYAKYGADVFGIEGKQLFNYYDTSDIVYVESALIKFYFSSIVLENTTTNPILRIYKYDYGDAVDEDDYSGGTLIATRTFTTADEGTWVEMAISADDVTVEGESHYRFALGAMEDLDYFPEPTDGQTIQQYMRLLSSSTIRLVVQGC